AVIEDGKLLFAHDKARSKPLRPAEEYFLQAVTTIRSNRRSYAKSKPARIGETVSIGFGAPWVIYSEGLCASATTLANTAPTTLAANRRVSVACSNSGSARSFG